MREVFLPRPAQLAARCPASLRQTHWAQVYNLTVDPKDSTKKTVKLQRVVKVWPPGSFVGRYGCTSGAFVECPCFEVFEGECELQPGWSLPRSLAPFLPPSRAPSHAPSSLPPSLHFPAFNPPSSAARPTRSLPLCADGLYILHVLKPLPHPNAAPTSAATWNELVPAIVVSGWRALFSSWSTKKSLPMSTSAAIAAAAGINSADPDNFTTSGAGFASSAGAGGAPAPGAGFLPGAASGAQLWRSMASDWDLQFTTPYQGPAAFLQRLSQNPNNAGVRSVLRIAKAEAKQYLASAKAEYNTAAVASAAVASYGAAAGPAAGRANGSTVAAASVSSTASFAWDGKATIGFSLSIGGSLTNAVVQEASNAFRDSLNMMVPNTTFAVGRLSGTCFLCTQIQTQLHGSLLVFTSVCVCV